MLGWFWDVLLEDPGVEPDADGPPGVERPAAEALLSAPGTLRLPSRSAVDAWDGPCRRGGGGGRPGEEENSAPELAREGGLRGNDELEPLMYGRDTLVDGVGGRIEEDAMDDADEVGLTGVLLLLMPYMGCDRPGKVRKGLSFESGELALWRLVLPLIVLGRGIVPEAVTGEWEGKQEKEAEEVEVVTGSGK